MRRVASIYFPRWAMECWRRRAGSDAPDETLAFALVGEGPHGFVLDALNDAAASASVRRGQRLTDARAICPELEIAPSDPKGDGAALRNLTLWAQRWSPWTALDGADGMLIDIMGAAHLWGGEGAMLADMAARFRDLGHGARIAAAPTIGAASALARFAPDAVTIVEERVEPALDPLAVESLRLESDTVLLLGRLGLKTIGALRQIPRLSLARRFAREEVGANPLIRLDQALGRIEEPVHPEIADTPLRVVRRVSDPIIHLPLLEQLLGEMAEALCAMLEARGLGLRRVNFVNFRVDGGVETVAAETARPVRDATHLLRLFDGKLDRLDAGFGFDAAALTAMRHEPMDPAQSHWLEAEGGDAQLSRLVDRLVAKLGPEQVRRPIAGESHLPERSVGWESAIGANARQSAATARSSRVKTRGARIISEPRPSFSLGTNSQRPLRLFDRPEAIAVPEENEGAPALFVWRRLTHIVARCEGPERIAPEWWRERSTTRLRDYYRVEDMTGRRYWLYREGEAGDGRGGPPPWFLHGLFA